MQRKDVATDLIGWEFCSAALPAAMKTTDTLFPDTIIKLNFMIFFILFSVPPHNTMLVTAALSLALCQYALRYGLKDELKGQFTPKSKMHMFPLPCSAMYQ